MRRSTLPRRLATFGAAALLLSGLAGAAAPTGVLAANRPVAHPIPSLHSQPHRIHPKRKP